MLLTDPLDAPVVATAQAAEVGDAEAHLLALHVAAGLGASPPVARAPVETGRQLRNLRYPLLLEVVGHTDHGHQDDHHDGQDHPTLLGVAHHASEGVAEGSRDEQYRYQLQEVGEGRGVLERMRRVGVEEAAAVGAQLLDGELRGHRTDRDGLRR